MFKKLLPFILGVAIVCTVDLLIRSLIVGLGISAQDIFYGLDAIRYLLTPIVLYFILCVILAITSLAYFKLVNRSKISLIVLASPMVVVVFYDFFFLNSLIYFVAIPTAIMVSSYLVSEKINILNLKRILITILIFWIIYFVLFYYFNINPIDNSILIPAVPS